MALPPPTPPPTPPGSLGIEAKAENHKPQEQKADEALKRRGEQDEDEDHDNEAAADDADDGD